MRIVTRLVDVLEGGLNPADTIGKFCVYLETMDGVKVDADIAYGINEMRASEDSYRWMMGIQSPVEYEVAEELDDKTWAHDFLAKISA